MKTKLFLSTFLLITGCLTAQTNTKKMNQNPFQTTSSGLQYRIDSPGKGEMPQPGDKVTVHYTGKLTNDTVFDSSVKRGQPFSFVLGQGQVIKGWDEGIALLHKGDKATLVIPPQLGYGEQSTGKIPANSILIFEVELIDFAPTARLWDMSGKDTIKTASGLEYMILEKGKGIRAQSGMSVSVHYSGFLKNGKKFDSSVDRGEPIKIILGQGQVIKGWDEGIACLNVGDKARLIIPWQLAYGEKGKGPIPPKADLIFDVQLVDAKMVPVIVPYDVKGKDTSTTVSGLKYIMIKEGTGKNAYKTGKVTVHYTGYFTDGRIFDSSVRREEPIQFQVGVGQVIKGWDEGLLLLKEGGKARFIIPYTLGYGEQQMGPIPAKSTLIFDVELLKVE